MIDLRIRRAQRAFKAFNALHELQPRLPLHQDRQLPDILSRSRILRETLQLTQ